MRFTKRSFRLGLLMLALAGCAMRQPETELPSLEYYQRWTRATFQAEHAWLPQALGWLLPEAHAELPPQYQSAFSLVIEPLAGQQALDAEYHSQMVMEPATHQQARQRLGAEAYAQYQAAIGQKLACETQVEAGWAGPAPKILRLDYANRRQLLYVGGPSGPAGPEREADERNTRRYLCNAGLEAFLGEVMATLKVKQPD
jgi:hypothetical protein